MKILIGQGDGIEASELANVRGEKEAVRRAMEIKNCEIFSFDCTALGGSKDLAGGYTRLPDPDI